MAAVSAHHVPHAAVGVDASRACWARPGINVIGRVMGLILAAVAMQFVLDGLHEAFPQLLGPN